MKDSRNRPKNSFSPISFQPQNDLVIIKDDPNEAVKDKLQALIELYHRTTRNTAYSEFLAFRVIVICLTSNYQHRLNISEEMHRLFNYCLKKNQLESIRLCFDLLLLKQIKTVLKQEDIRLLKVKLLKALYSHYNRFNLKEERQKCGYTLEEYCKASLSKDCIKQSAQIYQEILDALIYTMKLKVSRLVRRKNRINAIEQMTVFVGLLEKSEVVVSSKYQEELMLAYWALAKLHDELHYLAFTKKYATIAINISKRIECRSAERELKEMLDKLV